MKQKIPHPSTFINADDVITIRRAAPEAERMVRLHPSQLEIIYRQKWVKLLVPEVYGGLQITLPDLVRLQEAISWTDGSTGWVVTLCSGAGWFGGFLAEETAREVFKDKHVCLAGSGAPGGVAEITGNGYIINGKWRYASGVHHATHITANCVIKKDGETVLNGDGGPLILPFILDKKDVSILSAWKYVGMIATGSDSFEVVDLRVDNKRQFKIDQSPAVIGQPLYRYPFLQLAEATLAVNLSGIAIHFMDICEDIFNEKIKQPRITEDQKDFLFDELNRAKANMDKYRQAFFEAVDQSWTAIQNAHNIPGEILNEVSAASRKLARFSRESVDKLYPLCGLQAAGIETEINRAWRDLHTASQHTLLTFDS